MAAVSETEASNRRFASGETTGTSAGTSHEAQLRELVQDAHANGLRRAMILALEIGLADSHPEHRSTAAVIAAAIEKEIGETGGGADG